MKTFIQFFLKTLGILMGIFVFIFLLSLLMVPFMYHDRSGSAEELSAEFESALPYDVVTDVNN